MRSSALDHLGSPSLVVAGFRLWVHGRQFPESKDYWDANWLRVTACCNASGASVCVTGSILMVTDVEGFGKECGQLFAGRTTTATLNPLEPELRVLVESVDRLGHLVARVDITPDHLSQRHHMEFEIDQSYLSAIIEQCDRIAAQYPIVGQS